MGEKLATKQKKTSRRPDFSRRKKEKEGGGLNSFRHGKKNSRERVNVGRRSSKKQGPGIYLGSNGREGRRCPPRSSRRVNEKGGKKNTTPSKHGKSHCGTERD